MTESNYISLHYGYDEASNTDLVIRLDPVQLLKGYTKIELKSKQYRITTDDRSSLVTVFYYSKDSGSYRSPFGDYMYSCYGLPKDALGEQEDYISFFTGYNRQDFCYPIEMFIRLNPKNIIENASKNLKLKTYKVNNQYGCGMGESYSSVCAYYYTNDAEQYDHPQRDKLLGNFIEPPEDSIVLQ